MSGWNGKTKGSLWGYRFFVSCIQLLGPSVAYFFCYFVAGYFFLFTKKEKQGLTQFYKKAFGQSKSESRKNAFTTFFNFGKILIDRIAFSTKHKAKYSFSFNNEKVLTTMSDLNTGGLLISGHVGNWENSGRLIKERITSKINILMLDAEVEKIKEFLKQQSSGPTFNLIPIKDDMSHLILIHKAFKRNEFVALHADRTMENGKYFELDFMGAKAKFPQGPFILAEKFKVPTTFVFGVKEKKYKYQLSATDPINDNSLKAIDIAKQYVSELELKVRENPNQWFNFYDYYAS